MSTITSLQTTDTGSASRGIINTNFTNLNTDKLEKSGGTLTGEINFSGTTHAGVKLNSLTTTQRDALTPANGMIIYNTTTGQVEKYESGAWVGATGVANATSSVEGIVELATQSEIDNDTAIGGTGAGLGITPDQLVLSKYGTRLPTSDEKAALAGTSGTPSSTNKYVTNDDTATAATASKVARRLAGGNITVVTEAASNNTTNAASTAYVDNQVTLAATKLLVSGATTTLTNSTTETDMLTLTLTGGSLSTNNAIEIYIPITDFDKTASGGTDIAFRLKYGATTLATVTTDFGAAGATNNTGFIKVTLNANAATNAQRGTMQVLLTTSGYQSGGIAGYFGSASGTATEDSTANKTLSVTADWAATDAGCSITWANAKAFIVK